MNKSKTIISWILRILVALGFLAASLGKLTSNPQVLIMFDNWGYPNGFHLIIGVIEASLAILLLIPRTLKIALLGIVVVMIGAVFTHLLNDPITEVLRPLIFLIFVGTIYFINFRGHIADSIPD